MATLRELLHEVSEVWPVIAFIGLIIYGYIRLRFQVEVLKEKLKENKEQNADARKEIEDDIKGVSQKTNGFIKESNEELKKVRKEISDNHIKVSNDLHELKGMILVLSSEKK